MFKIHQKLIESMVLPDNHPVKTELDRMFGEDGVRIPGGQGHHLTNVGEMFVPKFSEFFFIAEVVDPKYPNLSMHIIKAIPTDLYVDQLMPYQKVRLTTGYFYRVAESEVIANIIRLRKFKHVVVPKKFLYRLPYRPVSEKLNPKDYIMIIDKINLALDAENILGFMNLTIEQADEIFDIIANRGFSDILWTSNGVPQEPHLGPQNIRITQEKKIVILDTEPEYHLVNWDPNVSEQFRKESLFSHTKHAVRQLKHFIPKNVGNHLDRRVKTLERSSKEEKINIFWMLASMRLKTYKIIKSLFS